MLAKSSLCCGMSNRALAYTAIATSVAVVIALAAIACFTTGLLAHIGVIKNLSAIISKWMMGGGSSTLGIETIVVIAIAAIIIYTNSKKTKEITKPSSEENIGVFVNTDKIGSKYLHLTYEELFSSKLLRSPKVEELTIDLELLTKSPLIKVEDINRILGRFPSIQKLIIDFDIDDANWEEDKGLGVHFHYDVLVTTGHFKLDGLRCSGQHYVFNRIRS